MKGLPEQMSILRRAGLRPGYNLVEVLIALGVFAVALPISMALVMATSSTAKLAEAETLGTLMARNVFEEVRYARDGQGRFITQKLTWPDFPGEDAWVILYANSSGEVLGRAEPGVYDEGVREEGAAYLLAVRGEAYDGVEHLLSSGGGGSSGARRNEAGLSRVELRVEFPAIAEVGSRNASKTPLRFVQLMPPSD